MIYPITPVPAPRQVNSDRWKQRPCVMRYRAFRDQVKLHRVKIPYSGAEITFFLPMPKGLSRKKFALLYGQPHQQKPDLDNLIKALFDAVFTDDCGIYDFTAKKLWSDQGCIMINTRKEP